MIQFIAPALNLITTVARTVGPTVVSFASSLIAKIPEVSIPEIIETVKVIANTISKVAEVYLLMVEDHTTIGAKVHQEDTRPRMDGESMEDYLNYLRNEVSLDTERLEKMSSEEKAGCSVVGTSMVTEAISEKTGVKISPEFLADMVKIRMTSTQLENYIKSFSQNNIDSMDSLSSFLKGKGSDKELVTVYNIVESVEKGIDPLMDDVALQSKIADMKAAIQE